MRVRSPGLDPLSATCKLGHRGRESSCLKVAGVSGVNQEDGTRGLWMNCGQSHYMVGSPASWQSDLPPTPPLHLKYADVLPGRGTSLSFFVQHWQVSLSGKALVPTHYKAEGTEGEPPLERPWSSSESVRKMRVTWGVPPVEGETGTPTVRIFLGSARDIPLRRDFWDATRVHSARPEPS